MNKQACQLLLLIALVQGSSLPSSAQAATATQQASDKPNIILILADDLGWRDVGFMGNAFIETPNLDKLAHEGLVFDRAYANAPNCAPSRAAIMSGQHALRTGVYTMMTGDMGDKHLRRVLTPPNKMYLEPKIITLAEMLKRAGYRTAQIGKWNLGTGEVRGPLGQGFDINIAGYRGGDAHDGYFAPYDYLPGLEHAPPGEYLTDRLTDEAIKVIRQSDQHPFFIYLAHFAPHYPFQAPASLVAKYQNKARLNPADKATSPAYAGMIESIDTGLGKILATLDETHQRDNTVIIFTSDNGGNRSAASLAPLRGNKSQLYEGGLRVPLMMWWPDRIRAGVTHEAAQGIDLFPTLQHLAQAPAVDQPEDGQDLSSLFTTVQARLNREDLFWYFPGYVAGHEPDAADPVFIQRPAAVIRSGDWKLIHYFDSNNEELYNLQSDPVEAHNVVAQQPDVRKVLFTKLQSWLDAMHAPLPLAHNPEYDAAAEHNEYDGLWNSLRQHFLRTWLGQHLNPSSTDD